MQVRVPVIKLKVCLDDGLEWAERKSVGSNSLRLVDFAIRLVNSVHDLPNEQVKF